MRAVERQQGERKERRSVTGGSDSRAHLRGREVAAKALPEIALSQKPRADT